MHRIALIFTLLAACRPSGPGPKAVDDPLPPSPPVNASAEASVAESPASAPPESLPAAKPVAPAPPKSAPPESEACKPFNGAAERREGNLLVRTPPSKPRRAFLGRLRSHVTGALSKGSPREWVGPPVPAFIPLYEGSAELHLLERSGDDFVAIYRDPYGAGSCMLSSSLNCDFFAVAYDPCGKQRWSRRLNQVMSRTEHLEVQDLRVADGIIYFNEACQSYARDAQGKCSSLLAYDPVADKRLWRTRPLVSNNRFLVLDDLLVTGYGFTDEPDYLFLVRRSDGKVLFRKYLRTAHRDIRMQADNVLVIKLYSGPDLRLELRGRTTAHPRLVPLRH